VLLNILINRQAGSRLATWPPEAAGRPREGERETLQDQPCADSARFALVFARTPAAA
jgi:hypothetical protein